MANLPSVEKRNRQAIKRRARNVVVRTKVKGVMKAARAAIETTQPGADGAKAKAAVSEAMRVVGRAKSKGVLHPRTASRKISRLAKAAHKKTSAKAE